jgi:hypothetical protein
MQMMNKWYFVIYCHPAELMQFLYLTNRFNLLF